MKRFNNFADLGPSSSGWVASSIVILPVPYDRTSTWVKGADKGPAAVISASSAVELYDIETGQEVYRQGIHTLAPLPVKMSPAEMVRRVKEKVSGLLDAGKFVVTLGGEHSVSIGPVHAHSARFKGLSVLQLDAHADLRDEYEGSRYNHACVMARVKEICPAVQVGIRSMCAEEKDKSDPEDIFFARDIAGKNGWIDEVAGRLSGNVYVTIDLDVFDPSIMPSTGTPEPGGLTWYPVMQLLRAVAEKKNIVGFDVVELCPNKSNRAPDFLAAKLIYKFLGYIHGEKKIEDRG